MHRLHRPTGKRPSPVTRRHPMVARRKSDRSGAESDGSAQRKHRADSGAQVIVGGFDEGSIKLVEDRTFIGESGSGHKVVLGTAFGPCL